MSRSDEATDDDKELKDRSSSSGSSSGGESWSVSGSESDQEVVKNLLAERRARLANQCR
jgi:hypothetical protein